MSWSISAEWAAYLAFPLVVLIASKLRSAAGLIGLLALLFITLWWMVKFGRYLHTIQYAMPRITVDFTAGVLLHRLWVLRHHEKNHFGDVLAILSLLAMVAGGNILATNVHWRMPMEYAPILACGIVYGLAIGRGWISCVLACEAATFGGRISYSFYMVHVIIIEAATALLAHAGVSHLDHWIVVAVLASFLSAVLMATYFYHRIEQPARGALVFLLRPDPAAPVAADPRTSG